MKLFDATFADPAANLACDEALLDACENDGSLEVLRFWEPADHFVVVGYANSARREVNMEACAKENIGVYRRCTGGGAVLQGPGCLNYSLVLTIAGGRPVQSITTANVYIMERQRAALSKALRSVVSVSGITDLVIGGRKFSGNAQRRKHNALLFHGTLLLGLDIAKVQKFLATPSRQPEYRQGRDHQTFIVNLGVPAETVKTALCKAWLASELLESPPDFSALAREKYSTRQWNLKY